MEVDNSSDINLVAEGEEVRGMYIREVDIKVHVARAGMAICHFRFLDKGASDIDTSAKVMVSILIG